MIIKNGDRVSSVCGDLLVFRLFFVVYVFLVRKDIDICKYVLYVYLFFKVKNYCLRYN